MVNEGTEWVEGKRLHWIDEDGNEQSTPLIVRKTSDETINNDDTLQNDDELLFAVAANEVWAFEINIYYESDFTPDIKLAVTFPNGATVVWQAPSGYDTSSMENKIKRISGASGSATFIADDKKSLIVMKGIIANGATAGNLQLQWAQGTATAVDTKMLANSHIIARKLA